MGFLRIFRNLCPGSGPRVIRSSSPPAPSDSMGCGRIDLLRPSGRTERTIDTLEHCHKPSYRSSRSGESNSDGTVAELRPTQQELFFSGLKNYPGIRRRDL